MRPYMAAVQAHGGNVSSTWGGTQMSGPPHVDELMSEVVSRIQAQTGWPRAFILQKIGEGYSQAEANQLAVHHANVVASGGMSGLVQLGKGPFDFLSALDPTNPHAPLGQLLRKGITTAAGMVGVDAGPVLDSLSNLGNKGGGNKPPPAPGKLVTDLNNDQLVAATTAHDANRPDLLPAGWSMDDVTRGMALGSWGQELDKRGIRDRVNASIDSARHGGGLTGGAGPTQPMQQMHPMSPMGPTATTTHEGLSTTAKVAIGAGVLAVAFGGYKMLHSREENPRRRRRRTKTAAKKSTTKKRS